MNRFFRKICVLSIILAFLGTSASAFFKLDIIAYAAGTVYIQADGSISPPSSPIRRDGYTYRLTGNIDGGIAVRRSNIIVEGGIGQYWLQGPGTGTGISIEGTYDNPINNVTIIGMVVRNFTNGIVMDYSRHNRITTNSIEDNGVGILFFGSQSGQSIVVGNYIGGNDVGVEVYIGSGSNVFYMNTFNDNGAHAKFWGVTSNVWDVLDYGGNYWSNYTGVDSSPIDGMGDAPHVINANNVDRKPVIGMVYGLTYEAFIDGEWVWITITVSSNSTEVGPLLHIPLETSEGTALEFNVTGSDGSGGFCRVGLPHTLLEPPYGITVTAKPVNFTTLFENDTLSIVYFTYTHSTKEVVIVPEFPAFMIPPLFMIASLFAVVVRKKCKANTALS